MHALSQKIENANLRLERSIPDLTASISGYVEWAGSRKQGKAEEVAIFRKQIESLRQGTVAAGDTYRTLRDRGRGLRGQNISLAFNHATQRQAAAYDKLVLNIEEVESFCLNTLFLVDKWFGGESAPESKNKK